MKQEVVPSEDGFVKLEPQAGVMPKEESQESSIGLKLKVSNGKIISDVKQRTSDKGRFQPLVGNEENDPDSDNDNLVVDENPKKRHKQGASTVKAGSLKLKLSCK